MRELFLDLKTKVPYVLKLNRTPIILAKTIEIMAFLVTNVRPEKIAYPNAVFIPPVIRNLKK